MKFCEYIVFNMINKMIKNNFKILCNMEVIEVGSSLVKFLQKMDQ